MENMNTCPPNRREVDFYQKLKQELAACTKNMKDFLFNTGLRYGRVMDPMRNLRGMSTDEIWGQDPVHPKDKVYALLGRSENRGQSSQYDSGASRYSGSADSIGERRGGGGRWISKGGRGWGGGKRGGRGERGGRGGRGGLYSHRGWY